jgi:flagellin-like hook-associated protein FlgL
MLTLSNDLSGIVERCTDRHLQINNQIGHSLSTGKNASTDTVDCFLGYSLQDKGFLLKTSIQNISYGMNTLAIADAHLNSISTLLQKSFNAICAIKNASPDQKAILQKIIDSNKQQIAHIINSASFDGKKLLQGGISNLQISTHPISIKNISEGRLFRTSFAQAINNWLAEDYTRCRYYQSQEEIQLDLKKNNSLIHASLWRTGSGTGHNLISMQQTCNAIINIRNIHPNISFFMESTLPESLESLRAIAPANAMRNFSTANYFQIFTASSIRPGHPNPGMKREFIPLIQDDTNINLSNIRNDIACTLLHDIYTNALNTIRNEQANIANQKQNLLSLADSIRSNSNVTEKASNSYLRTDYVLAAESYAENIRKVVSSITALQANNKIPDTIQKLLSRLAE